MKYLVTGKEMKLLDETTSQFYKVPSEILMEQAANVFVQELFAIFNRDKQQKLNDQKVLVLCGNGNNGGDGIAISRLLNQRGIKSDIYLCFHQKGSELLQKQLDIYCKYGYPILEHCGEEELSNFDVIIDGIFGTGLSRVIEGNLADLIQLANRQKAVRVAVDVPSGLSAEDGHVFQSIFEADYTITFSYEKAGLYLYPGADFCGQIIRKEIGITDESMQDRRPRLCYLEESDAKEMLPSRKGNTHKGTYGKLLIVAGSYNMAGAAILAAKAAYRSGVGLVKVVTPDENRTIMQLGIPEAILSTYGKNIDLEQLREDVHWADSVLIGPGLGKSENAKILVRKVLELATVPIVFDADALNILAEQPDILLRPHLDVVLTPHVGEMSRLADLPVSYIESHFLQTARDFSEKYNVICHLKSARSVTAVPYGISTLNIYGNSGMSTAGSGDVLSGIIGSLIAQGIQADRAAALGAFLHAQSGDYMAKAKNMTSLMASDLIDGLSHLAYLQ